MAEGISIVRVGEEVLHSRPIEMALNGGQ